MENDTLFLLVKVRISVTPPRMYIYVITSVENRYIRSFTTIGVLSVMHCEYCRFLMLAIVQSYYLTNPMFR